MVQSHLAVASAKARGWLLREPRQQPRSCAFRLIWRDFQRHGGVAVRLKLDFQHIFELDAEELSKGNHGFQAQIRRAVVGFL
jgi:hypothetical protein